MVLFLEEKNLPPAEYAGQTLHSKGFYPEVRVQDFPIRENKVELSIKRRRWELQSTGEIVSRNWDLVMKGARLTKEFALFLKKHIWTIIRLVVTNWPGCSKWMGASFNSNTSITSAIIKIGPA